MIGGGEGEEQEPFLCGMTPVPAEIVSLRALLHRRDDVQHMLRKARNRLEAGRMTAAIKQRVLSHVEALQAQFKTTEGEIKAHRHPPMHPSKPSGSACRAFLALAGGPSPACWHRNHQDTIGTAGVMNAAPTTHRGMALCKNMMHTPGRTLPGQTSSRLVYSLVHFHLTSSGLRSILSFLEAASVPSLSRPA